MVLCLYLYIYLNKIFGKIREEDRIMDITDKQYNELAKYIKETAGIDLGANKKALVSSRIRKLCVRNNINSYEELFKKVSVQKDVHTTTLLIDALTTNYTYFMREPDHFEYLKNKVLPDIKSNKRSKELNIWCAASSTGEEPYTLAMIIDSVLGEEKNSWKRQLIASDISTKVLATCKEGVYPKTAIAPLPAEWKNKYLKAVDKDNFAIVPTLKSQVLFKRLNLMDKDYHMKQKFDVIFCRNVMIYFDSETRNKLINRFYDMLAPGGYLFIGHSETVDKTKSKFKYVAPAIYRKEV